MKLTLWERIRRAARLLKGTRYTVKPIHPNAAQPNPTSPPVAHTPPTVKPGAGLTGKQKRLHQLMHATVGNPYKWTYNEVRPLYLPKTRILLVSFITAHALNRALLARVNKYRSDCSFGAKTLFWLAGVADDPTGEKWGPWGNSSSTYAYLRKRPGLDNAAQPKTSDLAKCKVGDILVVGQDGSDHLAVVMETGPNPLVWSDGRPGAPDSYRVLDDTRRPISVCVPKGWT